MNFCGYKINEYRVKIRDKGKRKLKKKVKYLTNQIYQGKMTSKEAKKYLAGHMGYPTTTIRFAPHSNTNLRLYILRNIYSKSISIKEIYSFLI